MMWLKNGQQMGDILIKIMVQLIGFLHHRGYTDMDIIQKTFDIDMLCNKVKHYQLFGTKMGESGYYVRYVHYVKDYISQFGLKNIVGNEKMIKDVMLHVLEDIAKEEHGFKKNELQKNRVVYSEVICSKYAYYAFIAKTIVENYKNPTDDEILDTNERKKAFLYTIKKLEFLIECIDTNQDVRDEFLKVTINMQHMLERKKSLPKNFLRIMKAIGANYILKDNDDESYFYPIILDLVLDIYRLTALRISEKEVYVLKNDIYGLDKALKHNKIQMEEGMRGRIDLFSKIDLKQTTPYVIEKYADVLNVDYEEVRKLYLYLAFGTTSGHTNRYPKIKGKVPSSRHLMFHHSRLLLDPK